MGSRRQDPSAAPSSIQLLEFRIFHHAHGVKNSIQLLEFRIFHHAHGAKNSIPLLEFRIFHHAHGGRTPRRPPAPDQNYTAGLGTPRSRLRRPGDVIRACLALGT